MPRRIALTNLNASTIDILNVIRANANYEYQSLVPEIKTAHEVPRVGEVIYGNPALSNQFLNSLVNRIALVRVKSATFNNAYANLKKGYLEFGETVEEVFVGIVKARVFNPENAEKNELKRSLPDVRSAFHAMNWRVQYPVTIQDEDLRQAFLSIDGVQDLIAKIVDAVYTSMEYDEFLLFKYMLIKAIANGKMKPVSLGNTPADAAVAFRATSNLLPFMSNQYNEAGVHTTTPKERQRIFMDATYNATYDVNVLASAFNMDKADFMGRLELIDNWTSFDNDRFDVIREQSDMLEEVTAEELALLANVKAVTVDEDWFQVYDNNIKFTEKFVASGMYWNYFLNTWKTFSNSPFANAVVFVVGDVELPAEVEVEITSKTIGENATTLTLGVEIDGASLTGGMYEFVQTEQATTAGVAIHKFGAVMIPADDNTELTLELLINGTKYTAQTSISKANEVGATVTFAK